MNKDSNDLAYKGEITLAFDYKATENSKTVRYKIETERISYVMIEEIFENERILPVIYINVNLSNDMYTMVTNSRNTSEFYLRIRKKNALSKTSIYEEVVNDTFSYVTPNTNANYSEKLNNSLTSDSAYTGTMIGLVSTTMTNELRKSFNGIYRNITTENLVKDLALGDMKNIIMPDIKYSASYDSILLPPLSSRYKLLNFAFQKYAFFDSYFTFFMDFKNTYLIPRNAQAVSANDGKPDTIIINIKDYTAMDAYNDGFTIKNNAYVLNVNGSDTNVIVNNATDKVTNNIIAYSDSIGKQNLSVVTNPNSKNEKKTSYVRSNSAAALKNNLQSNSVIVELLKQNVDPAIFTPNKCYNVSHYNGYEKYNGKYYLAYKREFYYINTSGEFTLTCNVGIKRAIEEEVARTVKDSYKPTLIKTDSVTSTKTSSSSKSTSLSTTKASRRV